MTGANTWADGRPGVAGWLLGHARRQRGWIVVYVLGTLLWHGLTSAMPLLIGRGFDAVVADIADLADLRSVVVLLLMVVMLRGLAGLAATYALEAVGTGLERDVRTDLFRSLLRKTQTFFDRRRVGDLSARATGDTDMVNMMVSPGLDLAFDLVLSIVVPIVVIGFIDPRLLLAPGVFVVVFVVAAAEHGRRLEPVSARSRERFGDLSAHVAESLAGMETIQAAGREDGERDRFAGLAEDYRDAFVRQHRVQALYFPPLLLALTIVGALVHGVLLARAGALSLGDVVAYLTLMGALRAPTQQAGFSIGLVYLGLAGARRILEVMRDPAEVGATEGVREPVRGAVSFEGVTFGHGDEPSLHDVSFSVPAGATVALVGPTGSGKTTVIALLNRTYEPDVGRVLVDGIDVARRDPADLRSHVAVIEQDVMLFSRSVADNIAFGVDGPVSREDVERAARVAQADEFVRELSDGYDTVLGERGVSLSGGQRQRLAIARAVLARPRILVLDDATSAVDSETEARIFSALEAEDPKPTTFVVTHRLSRIRSADHVVVLEGGRVVGQGTHEQLLDSCALYRRIFAPYMGLADDVPDEPPGEEVDGSDVGEVTR